MNFKTLAIFLSMSMLAPTINDQLDAAQHKKQTKKKKKGIKKHQRRAAPKQPIKLKDEQFMCQQQSCTLPTAQVEVLAATAATPPLPVATPDKKEDKLPVNVTPAATIDPKQDETKKTECDDHYGVYFGLGLGMANLGGKFSATGLTSGNISDTGLAKYSMTGDLHIGYLHKFGDFGIGVESYFDPLKMKSTNNYTGTGGAAQSYTVTLKNTFGFSMSCGYFIGEKTLGYIKAGFEKQKFTFTIVDNNTTALSDSKNQNTLAGGLGIRHQMGNWAVGAEYIYTKYKDMTSQNGGVSTSLKPNSNAIRFTLAYVI